MENVFIKIIVSVIYLSLALAGNYLIFCLIGIARWDVIVISIFLIIGLALTFLLIKVKTRKIIEKILHYLPFPLFIFIGVVFFVIKAVKSPLAEIIEKFTQKLIGLSSFIDKPSFYCDFVCSYILNKDNTIYFQMIIFFLIALFPLYSICNTAKNIAHIWSDKKAHEQEQQNA